MNMKDLQNVFGEMYLGKGGNTDVLFILENLRISCQMDAGGFEGLLYNMFSEEPFKNQRLDMTDEKNDYTISDYVFHHFGIILGETRICLTYHATKPPKILKYD